MNQLRNIKMLALTFELAREDSPEFKALLQRMEDEVEKISTWIEQLVKAAKMYVDHVNRCNEKSNKLANKSDLQKQQSVELLDKSSSHQTLRIFADALQCVFSFQAKLSEGLQESLIIPFQEFIKTDIKLVRELRRNYERSTDRYESAIQKYCSLSKTKEASSLREDAFQLYDIRKLYIKSCMEYTSGLIKFKYAFDHIVFNQFADSLDEFTEFYQGAAEVYRGFDLRMTALRDEFGKDFENLDEHIEMANKKQRAIEIALYEIFKPSSALPISIPMKNRRLQITDDTPIEKEGYLMRRIQKSPMLVPAWLRRWCIIRDSKFGVASISRNRGMVMETPMINIINFEIRQDNRQERRFCFELLSEKKNYTLQAESSEEFWGWLATLEAAKMHELQKQANDDSRDTRKLLEESYKINPVDDDDMDIQRAVSLFHNQSQTVQGSQDSSESSKSQSTEPKTIVKWSDFKYPESTLTRRNEELHSIFPTLSKSELLLETFPCRLYPQTESEDSTEGEVSTRTIQGRVYITAEHICFYSNSLDTLSRIKLNWNKVREITKKTIYGENLIVLSVMKKTTTYESDVDNDHDMADEEDDSADDFDLTAMSSLDYLNVTIVDYVFKSLFRDDLKIIGALNAVFSNWNSAQPLEFPDLFSIIYSNYKSPKSMEDAGSKSVSQAKMRSLEAALKEKTKELETVKESFSPSDEPQQTSWPEDAPPMPSEEVKCDLTDELDKTEIDEVFGCNARDLYEKIFESGNMFEKARKARNEWDITLTEWEPNEKQIPQRKLRWMFNVNQPMVKVKETDCEENQIIIKKDDHLCYVVDTYASTLNLPYGDAFQTVTRYVITFVASGKCRLMIRIGTKWFKSPMVKGIIKNAAIKGLSDFISDFMKTLRIEFSGSEISQTAVQNSSETPENRKTEKAEPTNTQSGIQLKIFGMDLDSFISESYRPFLIPGLFLFFTLFGIFLGSVFKGSGMPKCTSDSDVLRSLRRGDVKGVYFADLEDKIINSILPDTQVSSTRDYVRQRSFANFLKNSAEYPWHDSSLQQKSTGLSEVMKHSRKLRLNILESLSTLNEIESLVIENQYVHWMSDQIKYCWNTLDDATKKAPSSKPKHEGVTNEAEDDVIVRGQKLRNVCSRLEIDLKLFIVRSNNT